MNGENKPNGFSNQAAGQNQNQPYTQQNAYQNAYRQNPYGQQVNQYGQTANPYGQQANQYGQTANPYGQQVNPYGQAANPYGQQANPYAQQNPYGQQANPYGQQANPYAQQNPYGQQMNNPYGQQAGYQNPYGQQANPYGQYARQQAQNQPYQQAPKNPYPQQPAYQPLVPPAGSAPKKQIPVMLIVIVAVVLVLFAAGIVTGAAGLKIAAIIAAAAAAVVELWLMPDIARGNLRLGSIALYVLVMLISVILLFTGSGKDMTTAGSEPGAASVVTDTPDPMAEENVGTWEETVTSPPATVVPTEAADNGLSGECGQQLTSFFYFWSVNDLDDMVNLCAPSWIKSVSSSSDTSSAKKSLFSILANRVPVNYSFTAISGTANDASRTVTAEVEINKNNGSSNSVYIFKVIMLNEDGAWFVDPRSLESNETATATATNSFATQPPTPEPATADTTLYYNPDGGSYYHSDPNCSLIAAKYLPLKGTFRYSQVNDSPYDQLEPCSACAAPLREQ